MAVILDAGAGGCPALASMCSSVPENQTIATPSLLTVTKDGSGTGMVTSNPPGIDCGATCSGSFAGTVSLTASPDPGSFFSSWTGCDTVIAEVCMVDVAADRTVNATFELDAGPVQEVPTLGELGLALLALAIACLGWGVLRR